MQIGAEVYHILKKAGLNVGLAGNVGQSFAMQVDIEKGMAAGFEDYLAKVLNTAVSDYLDAGGLVAAGYVYVGFNRQVNSIEFWPDVKINLRW